MVLFCVIPKPQDEEEDPVQVFTDPKAAKEVADFKSSENQEYIVRAVEV